jgi:hypothetical protein
VSLIHLFPDPIEVLANVGVNRELTRGNTQFHKHPDNKVVSSQLSVKAEAE